MSSLDFQLPVDPRLHCTLYVPVRIRVGVCVSTVQHGLCRPSRKTAGRRTPVLLSLLGVLSVPMKPAREFSLCTDTGKGTVGGLTEWSASRLIGWLVQETMLGLGWLAPIG